MIAPPTPEQYERNRLFLVSNYIPATYACKKCQWPVIRGFCCNSCGDTNPSEPEAPKVNTTEKELEQ